METTQEPTQNTSGTQAFVKLLAIIGFFVVLGLIGWIVFQGIRMFPTAFSSLASIAETINDYRPQDEFVIESEKSIVNSGETFTINWSDLGKGSYEFTHECTEGVLIRVQGSEGILKEIPCTDSLILPDDAHGLFLSIQAKEQRFSDVPFTITFYGDNGDELTAHNSVTVVNATIPTKTKVTVTAPDTQNKTSKVSKETHDTLPLSHGTTPSPTPTPSQSASALISIVPQSYINGSIDLKASYLGVGTIEKGDFVPKATFDKDDTAAFKFEVKNIGTKTSEDWTYELILPGNTRYTSDTQTPLIPNEKAVFTISFELSEVAKNATKLEGRVTTKGDVNTNNNSFDWSVKIAE